MQKSVGLDFDGISDLNRGDYSQQVFVPQPDAAFGASGADRFGKTGAVDPDAVKFLSQTDEPRTVGAGSGTVAVSEIVGPVGGFFDGGDGEGAFGGLMVARFLLVSPVRADGAGKNVQGVGAGGQYE